MICSPIAVCPGHRIMPGLYSTTGGDHGKQPARALSTASQSAAPFHHMTTLRIRTKTVTDQIARARLGVIGGSFSD